jgi:protein-S-isoprenylcysteine O-methyltransferase Ste14
MNKASVLVIIQFTLFGIIGVSALFITTEKATASLMLGGGLMLAGIVVGLIAINEHGRVNQSGPNIVPIPKQHADLITSGLYQRIRHPIYTGVLLGAFGITIWHGHIITVFASLCLLALLTYKSRYEEELLITKYPDYVAYRRQTGRFLPKLRLSS